MQRGILLCLDYDGTLAEITIDPANAWPVSGVRQSIERIAGAPGHASVAIVTGRRNADIKRLLGIDTPILFSGLHSLEICEPDGQVRFAAEVEECLPELRRVRDWLRQNVPYGHGFWIEDKGAVVALHCRGADSAEAAALCRGWAKFLSSTTQRLKLVQLDLTVEAMPRAASKSRAIAALKAVSPREFATIYCGDDLPDEEVFAALRADDFGILVGPDRESCARYQVDAPHALAHELSRLAAALGQGGTDAQDQTPSRCDPRVREINQCRSTQKPRLTRSRR